MKHAYLLFLMTLTNFANAGISLPESCDSPSDFIVMNFKMLGTSSAEAEVIETWRKDLTWERPSWPLGRWHGKRWQTYQRRMTQKGFADPFGFFEEAASQDRPVLPALTSAEQQAMQTLELSFPFTAKQLQAAYREMVKKFHPDVNQGCLKAEETFKQINHAYSVLKNSTINHWGV